MSKLYKIRVTQVLVFEDYVEANSLEEASAMKSRAWCDGDSHIQDQGSDTREVTEATKKEARLYFGD